MIFCSTYDFLLHLSICWTKLHHNYKNQHRPTKLKRASYHFWLPISRESIFLRSTFWIISNQPLFIIKLHSGSTYNREISIFNFSVVLLTNTFILYHHFYGLSIVFTEIYKSSQIYLLSHFPSSLLLSHIYYK